MKPRPIGGRDHVVGLMLALTYGALLVATADDIGMSRDEGFYVRAAETYAGWFELLFEDAGAATEQAAIDRAWTYNHEHPALAKSSFALSWMAHQRWDLYSNDSMAFRFPGILCGALLLWLIWIFGARAFGRTAGAFAALAYALLPRPFYHAHLDAFDIPIVLMSTWVIYCYWRSLERPWWALWTGFAYGLALATKHNAWIIPGILLVHWLWVQWGELKRRERPRVVSRVPWWLLAMATMGPAIFFGTWPWMWNDVGPRMNEYVSFHVDHVYYNMAYFGLNYFEPPFPMSFPWVMTLFTVPITTIVLAMIGIGVRGRALIPAKLRERVWPSGTVEPDPRHGEVLLMGALLTPMIAITLPSSPIFGGTKHWFPSYPFLAIFAGIGFVFVFEVVKRRLRLGERPPMQVAAAVAATAALVTAPALTETIHSHPFGLSHYGVAAGGVPGAADHGMNRQFWGFTTRSLTDFFVEQMPDGGSVWICDTTADSWRMLQRDGHIPDNIRASWDMAQSDFILVHHEHHFAEVDFQAWVLFEDVQPAHVLLYDGVPIVTVYENPRRRRR